MHSPATINVSRSVLESCGIVLSLQDITVISWLILTLLIVAVDTKVDPFLTVTLSTKKPNVMVAGCSSVLLNSTLGPLLAHTSSPVSVAQENTTVSPGHTLSADESSVTVYIV